MKKAIFAVLMLVAAQARAGIYYNLANNASSDTLRVGYAGVDRNDSVFVASGTLTVQSTSVTAGYTVMQALNYAGSQILKLTQSGVLTVSSFIGNLTGNVVGNLTGNVTGNVTGVASQATIWDHSPTGCSAGNYPTGSDTGGNFVGCTAAGAGTVTTTAGAAAGSTARFTGPTTVSSGAFTDNGTTVTAPSGFAFIMNGNSNITVFLSSQAFSAASSFSLGVSAPTNATVDCKVMRLQNTSGGYLQFTFNGDTTSGHYKYAAVSMATGGTANSSSNSAAFAVSEVIGQLTDAAAYDGTSFSYVNAFSAATIFNGTSGNTVGNFTNHVFSGQWANSAFPTKLTAIASAGTMTGFARCTYTSY